MARLRRASGLRGIELAAAVGMSQPKISRIERGHGTPDPRDIGVLARALGAGEDQAQSLVERAERQHGGMTDWRPAAAGIAGRQKTMAEWESAASNLRIFDTALVPGPLQTSGYATAVFREIWQYHLPSIGALTERALLEAVSARIKRQEGLADTAKSFRFLVGESALKPRTISPVEMLAQIQHLREVEARHDNVSIGVIRDGAPTVPQMHGFTLLDDKLVVVELFNTGLTSRGRRDLEAYRQVFDRLDEHAVDIAPILDEYHARYVDLLRGPSGA
ncbi:helix-turn-helix domain-containing protein [Actinoplanes xinjiangensis]|uniref:helix-turn-helix domain-containing protein n=1 Tax=Actinoplanes xinjiangensis TaxID=512350 RepID=UPI0023B2D26B|nr:helix-turn-helix transcriptional regulator [Actinoplanes xinjiangensis]